jgi:hypothetical protein
VLAHLNPEWVIRWGEKKEGKKKGRKKKKKKKEEKEKPRTGVEPVTLRLRVLRSTD